MTLWSRVNTDLKMWLSGSVSDPHWFQCGLGSSILGHCGSGSRSRVLMTKNGDKFIAEKFHFSFPKASLKDVQAAAEAFTLHLEHPAFKTWNFLTFFWFCGSFFPPGSVRPSGSSWPKSMRIRIRSETLFSGHVWATLTRKYDYLVTWEY